jgi:NADPH-ferrihemoprotein reductase
LTNAGLENLGGNRIFDYGEGDDDASLEDDFENWRAKLWPSLVQQFHPEGMKNNNNNNPSSVESTPRSSRGARLIFDTVFIDGSDAKAETLSLNLVNTSTKHFFTAPWASITTNRELRSTAEGSTRHIELSLRGITGGLKYETADNLAVLPENDSELVLKLCQCMDYNPKQVHIIHLIIVLIVCF